MPLLLTAALLAGCISIDIDGDAFDSERGSGTLVSEDRAVASFSGIEVSGALRAEIAPGALSVEVLFDDNLVDRLETVVRGSTLRVSCQNCSPTSGAVIRLTAPELETIHVSGASRVTATDINAERLLLSVSGASRLEIDGEVNALEIDGSGASRVEGRNLLANRLEIGLSGASRAEVAVVERAEGDLSGASSLEIAGTEQPSVDVRTSGGSSVRR